MVVHSDVVGTVTASTKILTSGKVLGKPIQITTKNEWMQRIKKKYQRDSRGYIIDNVEDDSTKTTHEHKESKGKEATGKGDATGKEKPNNSVKISNQICLIGGR